MAQLELVALTPIEVDVIKRFREQVKEVSKVLDQMQCSDIASLLYKDAGMYSYLVSKEIIQKGHKTKNKYLVDAGKDLLDELLH